MKKNYIEEEFKSKTYFKDEAVFNPEYIPKKLIHRENELVLLSKIFLPVIKSPNSISRKVLITGNVGVGKTVTLQYFASMLQESAKKRNLNIEICHINCRTNRTSYLILKSILEKLHQSVPARGLAPTELLNILIELLKSENMHLILILDELGFIKKKHADILYSFSRINEIFQNEKSYISIIGVLKNLLALNHLDNSILSTLQNHIIRFNKYNENQIFDILENRAESGLIDGIISQEMLHMISNLAADRGDMRKALRILKNAALYAERKFLPEITPEAIRVANSEFCPVSDKELFELNTHEMILYKAICSLLGQNNHQNVSIMEIKAEYTALSDLYGLEPRSYTQIWGYIQNLKKFELIDIKIKNRDIQGRKSLISTPIPAQFMEKKLANLLKKKLIGD